jgi:CRISPR-associated exonuclease Cas4
MYVQRELEINAPMLEGTFQHQTRSDLPGTETDEHGRTVHRRIWVWSERLEIAGFADFVEETESGLVPVEYKHGQKGKWANDEIQLCAQALCLEEMTGQMVAAGEIFYWRSRRRVTVTFDDVLRQATESAVAQAQTLITANRIPLPIQERQKCKACSIQPICLPDEVERLERRIA